MNRSNKKQTKQNKNFIDKNKAHITELTRSRSKTPPKASEEKTLKYKILNPKQEKKSPQFGAKSVKPKVDKSSPQKERKVQRERSYNNQSEEEEEDNSDPIQLDLKLENILNSSSPERQILFGDPYFARDSQNSGGFHHPIFDQSTIRNSVQDQSVSINLSHLPWNQNIPSSQYAHQQALINRSLDPYYRSPHKNPYVHPIYHSPGSPYVVQQSHQSYEPLQAGKHHLKLVFKGSPFKF